MKFLNKSIGFMAVLACIPAAYSLTVRPGTNVSSAYRMPSLRGYTSNLVSTNTTASTVSSLLADAECIDSYTTCMEGGDACGPNFEECTTTELFHAQMPKCISTLYQCNASGIISLFGASATATNLSAITNGNVLNAKGKPMQPGDEGAIYTYPTATSVMGQRVAAAMIANRYDTGTCVKKYTNCLHKENVCGNDFELCTDDKSFKLQKVLCASVLERCPTEGLTELFGQASKTINPQKDSRVRVLIDEGAALAAVNSVSTCYKVIDQCILGACSANPYKCFAGSSSQITETVESIVKGEDGLETKTTTTSTTYTGDDLVTAADVRKYVANNCQEVIGTNKYCYATFLGNGILPTSSQLKDEDNQAEIFDEAYTARMATGGSMQAKLTELMESFDTMAKNKCYDTIKSCAMRVCGGGNGAACYALVFNSDGTKTINAGSTYEDIKAGCEAVVNTDLYCKYAGVNTAGSGVSSYAYAYAKSDTFDRLFPESTDGTVGNDPIGVVAKLNSALATAFNKTAIDDMRASCEAVAKNCIRSMCGDDYANCYRRRDDVVSAISTTEKTTGVLDSTVVIGLCLDTVKSAPECENHLAIAQSQIDSEAAKSTANSWGSATSVRNSWTGAVLKEKAAGSSKYRSAEETLFGEVMENIQLEAQSIYDSKLNAEMNACLNLNKGGLSKGEGDGTYTWAKLSSNASLDKYASKGLSESDASSTNEKFGGFCRIRVTLRSDDPRIQAVLDGEKYESGRTGAVLNNNKNAMGSFAYFAAGDTFICGSWLDNSKLEKLANAVAKESTANLEAKQKRTATMIGVGTAIAGLVGGGFLGDAIQQGKVFGKNGVLGNGTGLKGLKTKSKTVISNLNISACLQHVDNIKASIAKVENCISDNNTDVMECDGYSTFNDYWQNAKGTDFGIPEEYLDSDRQQKVRAVRYAIADFDAVDSNSNFGTKRQSVVTALNSLEKDACAVTETEVATKTKAGAPDGLGAGLGAVLTSAATTGLALTITRGVQKNQLDEKQQEAYDEFMADVGNHIYCYIGNKPAGTYGAIVETDLK